MIVCDEKTHEMKELSFFKVYLSIIMQGLKKLSVISTYYDKI